MKLIEDIIRENVQQVINEHIYSDKLIDLYKLLTLSEQEKEEFLIEENFNKFYDFIIDYRIELDEKEMLEIKERCDKNDYGLVNEIIFGKYEDYYKKFLCFIVNMYMHTYDKPAFLTLEEPEYFENSWLIHFSDKAEKISKEGFIYGVDNYDGLTVTGYGKGHGVITDDKVQDGFNFAYDANDFRLYFRNFAGNPKYGHHAVLFKSNGIKVFHNGDNEYQVIFWGPTAKNLIFIENFYYREIGERVWCIRSLKTNKITYYNKDLSEVVKWAINNYDQYQRSMVNYEADKRFRNYETNYIK